MRGHSRLERDKEELRLGLMGFIPFLEVTEGRGTWHAIAEAQKPAQRPVPAQFASQGFNARGLEHDEGDIRIPYGPHGIIVPALVARFLPFLHEGFIREMFKDKLQAFEIAESGNFVPRKQGALR
ncbi:MAG: hypothetical protein KM312_00460 [Hydrogenibacillus schlegelii]|uniref:Uncharacterized protein n=1 Tax=Hydrogenibacillus schlegelii TaxID=1484 RepID=A0A947CZ22_HYDSH|nr:hypothetical protein [Hydrogenibacillus schlegelii]